MPEETIKQQYLEPESEHPTWDEMRAFVNSSLTNLSSPMRVQSAGIQSANYVEEGDGWKLTATTAFLPNITLSGGTIKYQKTSFTDSTNKGYHISSSGFYFGSASDASYIKYNLGTADFTIHGVNVTSPTLTNLQSGSEISIQDWTHDMTFSSTDLDTVSWTSGTITLLDGTTYSIDAGNTGNMSASTYIYLDIGTSLTVLQTTTTAGTAVGSGKILIAFAKNSTTQALFQVYGGKFASRISGVDLENLTVDTAQLAASAVEAAKIATNAVETAKINAGAITAAKTSIAAINSTTGDLTSNSVGSSQIQTDAVIEGKVLDDAITATKIAVNGLDGTTGNVATDHIVAGMIQTNAITSAKVLADAITAAKINVSGLDGTSGDVAANHIVAGMIQTNAITSVKILADAVTASKINVVGLDGTSGRIVVADATDANVVTSGINSHAATLIQAGKIVISGAVNLDDWSSASDATYIDGGKVYTNSITASQIAATTITASELATNCVTAVKILAGAVTAKKLTLYNFILSAGSWTDDSPGAGSVAWASCKVVYNGSEHTITNGNTANKFIYWQSASPTVFATSASLPSLGDSDFIVAENLSGTHLLVWNSTLVDGGRIRTGSVTATQITASTITANELATNCVTSAKILADAVTATKINVVGLDGATGRIVVADATDADVVTGGINSHAVTLIEAGKIVISGATNLDDWRKGGDLTMIDGGSISTNTITATQIFGNTITASEIAANTITASEILGNTITASEIAANTITANEILGNTITAAEIAATTITATEISTGLYTEIDSNLPSDENLVGYWAFDEGQGSKAYDGSGNSNTGTLNNMEDADWVDGVAGSCLDFDGTNEDITISDDTSLQFGIGDFTISLWVYPKNTSGTWDTLISKLDADTVEDGWGIRQAAVGTTFTFQEDANVGGLLSSANYWTQDVWQHCVITRKVVGTTGTYSLYKNGVLITSTTKTVDASNHNLNGTDGVAIASLYTGGTSAWWQGQLDEIRIWKGEAITAKEVYALYKNPSGNPSLATPMGRLTSGSIYSKQITLAVSAGVGDAKIQAGKTDFTNTDAGFILGIDDSDSDKAKFYLGDATTYLNWNGGLLTVKGTIDATSGWFGSAANGVGIDSTGLTLLGTGYIRTVNGNDRVELDATNNQLSCYNSNVLIGKIGKTGADGSFILYSGTESSKVPMLIENKGTANVVRFRQNNSNVNCDPAAFFESNASGGSYADTVATIHAGGIWNGSAWVENTASTIGGLAIETAAKGYPLIINNAQAATANKVGDIRMLTQAFQQDYGSSGMFHNYNNRMWASMRNHDASSWINYKLGRYENGLVSFGALSIGGGGGSQTFTGTVTYANQFPEAPSPQITAVLTSTANIGDVSVLITASSATSFSYWVRFWASAANTGNAYITWHASEDFNNT